VAARKQTFKAPIEPGRGGGAFVVVPFSVEEAFGTRGQVRVKGTIDGHAFRSSIAPMSGSHVVGVHKATREAIGKNIGDTVTLVVEADSDERILTIPDDLRRALGRRATTKRAFDALAHTHRKEYVQWVESAKKPETRARRVAETVNRIAAGLHVF
jgi:bifunctional DNA-binding transcriptional regulator/antitoxin component of YhaV-PrlF toxin-antitoxin module